MQNDKKENKSEEIYKLRKLINVVLDILDFNIKNKINSENQYILESIIGKKTDIISAICKLGNLILKINIDDDKSNNDSCDIEEIDLEILRDYYENTKN